MNDFEQKVKKALVELQFEFDEIAGHDVAFTQGGQIQGHAGIFEGKVKTFNYINIGFPYGLHSLNEKRGWVIAVSDVGFEKGMETIKELANNYKKTGEL